MQGLITTSVRRFTGPVAEEHLRLQVQIGEAYCEWTFCQLDPLSWGEFWAQVAQATLWAQHFATDGAVMQAALLQQLDHARAAVVTLAAQAVALRTERDQKAQALTAARKEIEALKKKLKARDALIKKLRNQLS